MRAAVTGGSGYIGSRLVLDLEHIYGADAVRNFDIEGDTDDPKFVYCDLTEDAGLIAQWQPEIVYHLAGPVVGGMRRDPAAGWDAQVGGTLSVLSAISQMQYIPRLVFASSFYVYDGHDPRTTVNEHTPLDLNDMELFGAAKFACERLIRDMADRYDIEYVLTRFGSVYGGANGSNVVRDFMETAARGETLEIWGRGDRRNQYTYLADVVRGLLLIIDYWDEVTGEPLNLISPDETTTRELAGLVTAMFNTQAVFLEEKPEPPSMPYMWPGRAMHKLDWNPETLRDGMSLTSAELELT